MISSVQGGVAAPWRRARRGAALILLSALSVGFVIHAASLGLDGLDGLAASAGRHRLFDPAAPIATAAVGVHMIAGAAITLLAPAQLSAAIRRRWPTAHRRMGYALAAGAVVCAVAGILYIGLRGTIGGPHMDVAFAVYGLCMVVAALQTVRCARARAFARHRAWALRLAVLALGSWLYRVHYTIWAIATGGVGSAPDFSGVFDQIQLWAFFVPYLLAVEIYLRRRSAR